MRAKRRQERQQQEEAKRQTIIARRQAERAVRNTIQQIAQSLGETDDKPRGQIERIVNHLGIDQALDFLRETEQIEEQGGMMLTDGSRRRSKGGVYFHLVRQQLQAEQRQADIKTIFTK
jgi:phosphorylated adapter RNA export protein